MARIITKIGDVFSVKIDESTKKYFQYISNDLTQLNSDVIRAFKEVYPLDAQPELSAIVGGAVEFYAHCVTNFGPKMGYWEKVGNIKEVGRTDHILFRGTSEAGGKPGEQIKVSDKWYIWHINDKDYKRVGKLEGENRKAEIGSIMPPAIIVHRMKTGKYNFAYPDFE